VHAVQVGSQARVCVLSIFYHFAVPNYQKKRMEVEVFSLFTSCFKLTSQEKNPLTGLKIDDSSFLLELQREKCPKCNQNRKMYCYDCLITMGDQSKVPKVALPIDLVMYASFRSLSFLGCMLTL
jgi:hypothetical protein